MPDYSKGKIYKIVCNETGLVYIGSTTQNLNRRLQKHKSEFNCNLDSYNRNTSCFVILQFGNYYIELIENYPCNSRTDLEMREGYWQKQIDCVNIKEAGYGKINKKEWQRNYDKIRKSTPEYKAHHRDYMRERRAKKKLELQSNQNNNLDV